MYTLISGEKVKELIFKSSGFGSWETSQYYWLNGKKVKQEYNTETKECRITDAMGNIIEVLSKEIKE